MTSPHRLFGRAKTVIGVIHLPPLPGYAASPGLQAVIDHAVADFAALAAAGVDGVLVENEHDHPHRVTAAPETTAAMTLVADALVRRAGPVAIGVEILLNDPAASLAVAALTGASFIRTDYFVDAMERPEFGPMAIDPVGLMLRRRALGAGHVLVLADVQVKFARMIAPRSLAASAADAVAHEADAIVVTGAATGSAPSLEDLREATTGAQGRPVLVGSGLGPHNIDALLSVADGAIVGTSLMQNGRVDVHRAAALVAAARALPARTPSR